MSKFIYDLEIVTNAFTIVFIDADTPKELIDNYVDADINNNIAGVQNALAKINHKKFIIFDRINDLTALYNFLLSSECAVLIGYNSSKYDDVILDYIIHNYYKLASMSVEDVIRSIYDISQSIINNQELGNPRKVLNIKYSGKYTGIDLMRLHALDKSKTSLKQIQIILCWYRVEDYTPPEMEDGPIMDLAWYEIPVTNDSLPKLLKYNVNDVLSTLVLYWFSKDELVNRINIRIKEKLNVLSDSRSLVADKLLSKAYSEATGLSYWDFADKRTYRRKIRFDELILPEISFKTPELQSFSDRLKTKVINIGTDKFEELVIYNGTGYNIAKGGLHSKDRGDVFVSNDKFIYIDVDADSYYPTGAVNYKIKAEHLNVVIIDIIDKYRVERIEAKKNGDKSTADIGKIVLNSGVFGKLGHEYSWMFDLKALYKVTINLQLILLTLIEDLEVNGFHVVSANTDGIVTRVAVNRVDEYKAICSNWSTRFNFGVEYTEYAKYVRIHVNSYISITTSGKIKTKGDFITELNISKGYFAPVIAKVLYEYFVNDNKDIDTLIRQFDIYDYCIAKKIGGQFTSELHSMVNGELQITHLQKDNRYYVSTKGGIFLKKHKITGKLTNVISKQYVTIFNTYYKSDNYNINYDWYKARVNDMLDKIYNKTTKIMKSTSGTMFDDLY